MVLLYNFASIKNRLTFILFEIFKPLTFLFLRNQSVTQFRLCVFRPGTNNFQTSGQFTLIFELSGIVSSNLVNSDLVRIKQGPVRMFGSGMNKIGQGKNKKRIRYEYFGSDKNKFLVQSMVTNNFGSGMKK